ncbi:MAG: hypothetical protein M1812_004650 [Candelaria pacifica]|nr:MAG: hypothetical protein M1812_004650 [Candelaria pacifica]
MYFSIIPLLYALSLSLSTGSTLAYDTCTPSVETLSAIAIIKNIVSLKNLITANKEYSVLQQIATEDVVLQIRGGSPDYNNVNVSGLANVTSYISKSDGANIIIRESSSQFVELLSPTTARSLSNTQENYFGQGNSTGQIEAFFERNEDLLRVDNGTWKIFSTTLTVVGGPIGNRAVFVQ